MGCVAHLKRPLCLTELMSNTAFVLDYRRDGCDVLCWALLLDLSIVGRTKNGICTAKSNSTFRVAARPCVALNSSTYRLCISFLSVNMNTPLAFANFLPKLSNLREAGRVLEHSGLVET